MTGGDVDPASVLTAVEKADLAFRMMLQMRNKVMQVYQEVKDIGFSCQRSAISDQLVGE